jgi:anti-sigma28 factor (negative regulator of flagellin synthesis)
LNIHAESLSEPLRGWPAQPDRATSSEAATFSDVRYARIAELRRQIAAGTYVVSAGQLADAVLRAIDRNRFL